LILREQLHDVIALYYYYHHHHHHPPLFFSTWLKLVVSGCCQAHK
jgi:hypothetical protein